MRSGAPPQAPSVRAGESEGISIRRCRAGAAPSRCSCMRSARDRMSHPGTGEPTGVAAAVVAAAVVVAVALAVRGWPSTLPPGCITFGHNRVDDRIVQFIEADPDVPAAAAGAP